MNDFVINIAMGLLTLFAGLFISATIFKNKKLFDFEKKKKEAEEAFLKGKQDAELVKQEALKKVEKIKENILEEERLRAGRVEKIKEILKHKDTLVFKKEERINEIRLKIAEMKEETQSAQETIKKQEKELRDKLTQKTGQNPEELKEKLEKALTLELEETKTERLASIENDLKEDAEKEARKIIVSIIQRFSSPTSVESKLVHVKVPKDHIKGKIVGKNAENILAFEKQLDVDVIFNDLPNTISVSCFNLVTRRIAQRALEKLIRVKGDIHAKIIEKAIGEAKEEVSKELYEIGKSAIERMGIKIQDKELIRTIGRLQFRTSYGQNILKHSMEVAWIATMLASELNLKIETTKIGGFLHDLGKAIDQDPEIQDAHDHLTKELMEKYGYSDEEVHAAWTHHEAIKPQTPEALVVKAADAISAGRPGARQESIVKYAERLQALEETANFFEGVKKSYAISAGRELRALVDPERVSDQEMKPLAHEIAQKIESELSYPGKVKVNLIRRTKFIEVAK